MRFRWPVRSYECDECGHVTRGLQKPWYTPRPSTVTTSQIIRMSEGEFKTFLEAGTNPTLDMHIPSLKRPVS